MSVNFIPDVGSQAKIGAFRFWCQKVLPLVYDESLSYYELLCKVVNYLNTVIESMNECNENVSKLYTSFTLLHDHTLNELKEHNEYLKEEVKKQNDTIARNKTEQDEYLSASIQAQNAAIQQNNENQLNTINGAVAKQDKAIEDAIKLQNQTIEQNNQAHNNTINNAVERQDTYLTQNINNLTDSFTALNRFVEGYFTNLDVQDEINNKLDAMAEDGTLSALIEAFYVNAPKAYNTFIDAVGDIKLVEGNYFITGGFYTVGDGGACVYRVENDEAITDKLVISADRGVCAVPIDGGNNVRHYGAHGNGIDDDSGVINAVINSGLAYIPVGTFLCETPIRIVNDESKLICDGNLVYNGGADSAAIVVNSIRNYIDIRGKLTSSASGIIITSPNKSQLQTNNHIKFNTIVCAEHGIVLNASYYPVGVNTVEGNMLAHNDPVYGSGEPATDPFYGIYMLVNDGKWCNENKFLNFTVRGFNHAVYADCINGLCTSNKFSFVTPEGCAYGVYLHNAGAIFDYCRFAEYYENTYIIKCDGVLGVVRLNCDHTILRNMLVIDDGIEVDSDSTFIAKGSDIANDKASQRYKGYYQYSYSVTDIVAVYTNTRYQHARAGDWVLGTGVDTANKQIMQPNTVTISCPGNPDATSNVYLGKEYVHGGIDNIRVISKLTTGTLNLYNYNGELIYTFPAKQDRVYNVVFYDAASIYSAYIESSERVK